MTQAFQIRGGFLIWWTGATTESSATRSALPQRDLLVHPTGRNPHPPLLREVCYLSWHLTEQPVRALSFPSFQGLIRQADGFMAHSRWALGSMELEFEY